MRFPRFVCPECGLPFGLPSHFVALARADGRDVYCPNGHVSRLTDPERPGTIRRRLEAKDRRIARLESQIAEMEASLSEN